MQGAAAAARGGAYLGGVLARDADFGAVGPHIKDDRANLICVCVRRKDRWAMRAGDGGGGWG